MKAGDMVMIDHRGSSSAALYPTPVDRERYTRAFQDNIGWTWALDRFVILETADHPSHPGWYKLLRRRAGNHSVWWLHHDDLLGSGDFVVCIEA